jgi:hypothetical protein
VEQRRNSLRPADPLIVSTPFETGPAMMPSQTSDARLAFPDPGAKRCNRVQ